MRMKMMTGGMIALALVSCFGVAQAADIDPFLGRWALTIPGGGAGWLEVTKERGYYDSSILWGGGSVVPTASTYVVDDVLFVTRTHTTERKDKEGKVLRTQTFTEVLRAQVDGDTISIIRHDPRRNGKGENVEPLSGFRIPDLPPAPDLSKAKRGTPMELLKGNTLDGWSIMGTSPNAWTMADGVLINEPEVNDDGSHVRSANIRTDAEYEDFNLTTDVFVVTHSNSGIYLRGIYEVQVEDSFDKETDAHTMGGLYSRISPSVKASKTPEQWQHFDITLLDRHLTVILNGVTIIDNQPVQGCTGGAMTSDESKPGPLYLQGDHGAVKYRNMVLTPLSN